MIAKGDSKRLPNKNLLPLGDQPMFVYNLKKLIHIFYGRFERVYLSTESQDIIKLVQKHHLQSQVNIIDRPIELCGETPDIAVYQHAVSLIPNCAAFVAVHADTPLTPISIIRDAKMLLEEGVQEIMTCHPMTYSDDYKSQHNRIYGSVRAMTVKRLESYEDPYRPRPEVLLVDPSPEIETREDYDKIRCSMFQ